MGDLKKWGYPSNGGGGGGVFFNGGVDTPLRNMNIRNISAEPYYIYDWRFMIAIKFHMSVDVLCVDR